MSEQPTIRSNRELDFLLEEFSSAFEVIQKIDDRRLRFVEFLISFHAVLATAVVALTIRDEKDQGGIRFSEGDVALLWVATGISIVATLAILWMVLSERDANLRYRRKINHIRGIFLLMSTDTAIQTYLKEHKSLGTPTQSIDQPHGLGRTLKGVVGLCVIFTAVWVLAATYLTWAQLRA